MTREEAIAFLIKDKEQRGDCFISEALDMAIKALEQEPCEDCRNCKKWDDCPCGKDGHESGTSQGYSIGECKDFEPQESEE